MNYERLYALVRKCRCTRYDYLAARNALFTAIAELAADPSAADELMDHDDLRFACELDRIKELIDGIKDRIDV